MGDDPIEGGDGTADVLDGGEGDDTIRGGAGEDKIAGAAATTCYSVMPRSIRSMAAMAATPSSAAMAMTG